jgi:hypothetical protein
VNLRHQRRERGSAQAPPRQAIGKLPKPNTRSSARAIGQTGRFNAGLFR